MSTDDIILRINDDDSSDDKKKRTRISPRLKAFDEVVSLINDTIISLKEEDDPKENALSESVVVLNELRDKITDMAQGGAPKTVYAGRHYIGVNADGERVGFQTNTTPTQRTHGTGSKSNFVSVLGPFRTESGVAWRIAHPETQCQVIF